MKTYQALILCTMLVAALSAGRQVSPGPAAAGPGSRQGRLLFLLGKKALLLKAPLLFKGGALKAVGAAGAGLGGLGGLGGLSSVSSQPSYVVASGGYHQQQVHVAQPVLIAQHPTSHQAQYRHTPQYSVWTK